jgi:hypothetical protein
VAAGAFDESAVRNKFQITLPHGGLLPLEKIADELEKVDGKRPGDVERGKQ